MTLNYLATRPFCVPPTPVEISTITGIPATDITVNSCVQEYTCSISADFNNTQKEAVNVFMASRKYEPV